MPKPLDLMSLREKKIGAIVERLRASSLGFTNPTMVLIGGYALRAYVPYARYSRDCDFVLPKGRHWNFEQVPEWLPQMSVESNARFDTHGFLRLVGTIALDKLAVKVSLDFMEGAVRDRSGASLAVDKRFISDSFETEIRIGDVSIPVRVPSYPDYLLLKLLPCRPSDIRDIAALVWKHGAPASRSSRITPPDVRHFTANLDRAVEEISHPRFVDSWRGTFITQEFGESDKRLVLKELRKLKNVLAKR